ncbi:DUF4238 domain-containing protein [Thioclava sp. F36-6]|uniref:DUF4238 domain-containing protein n=1 Tax=Thioclava sp. F36-6 TaxID=1915316 RepID=UPI000998315E|nr:DUF4238 domain-containing protein [Thioclava sp. F36-6]OOY32929.1 hypothetical protein BMI88_03420 [Thioclava sp. F36-6]
MPNARAQARARFIVTRKRSRNHHYVPKCIQRHFCGEGERLWYAERNKSGRFLEPEERNIRTTFREKDRNTILLNGQPSDIVEHSFFEKLDNYLGKTIPEIVDIISEGAAPEFSEIARLDFIYAIYESLRRSPDFFDIDEASKGEELVRGQLSKLDENKDSSTIEALQATLASRYELRKLGRDIRVRAAFGETELSEKIKLELKTLEVRWAISNAKHSFALPSSGCYRVGNGGSNGLSNENVEIWMPITPKISIVLLRDPNKRIPPLINVSRDLVRRMNEYATRNSRAIASHSGHLIYSLTGYSRH